MVPALKKYKAAAVNAEPGWFDLQESVRRTIHWINEAGENGCKLIAFPELCKHNLCKKMILANPSD
jgi:cyanide hydratase